MKNILEFCGYSITKNGKVWSHKSSKWLKVYEQKDGHLFVSFSHKGKTHKRFVHRLLLQTYVGECPEGMECRHLDDNPKNNNLSNLKWGTHKENMQDTINNRGRNGGNVKLSEADVLKIVDMYETGWFTIKELAGFYNVSHSCVGHIVEKRNWKHVWSKST